MLLSDNPRKDRIESQLSMKSQIILLFGASGTGKTTLVGPIPEFEPFSIMSTEPPSELRGGRSIAAHHRTPLGTLQKTRSPIGPRIGCGKAGHGRAGQAFALVESGVVDGATANSSPRTAAGHKQGDQAAKTKPPAGSCSRILDQSLGPMGARSSKHWPLE
jgi:hypothetical protein